MKKITFILALLLSLCSVAQIPVYYNDVNLTLTGLALKNELSSKITVTHTTILQYTDVWAVLQQTDLDPTNSANVLLLYGYNDGDGNPTTDRTRNKNSNGGNIGDWNREHTYAKSLGTPDLGTINAGADAHHLRSTDVQMNNDRGSKKFTSGSGNAGTVGSNWYPGNEWKGDVARMMMYMYLRYPSQCLPNNVGVGTSVAIDPAMIDLFLQWNAADPVSVYEENRNDILETEQGNRNPFIDNPYLATIIWGGTVAQDNWNMTVVNEYDINKSVAIYPMPANNNEIHLYFKTKIDVEEVNLYNVSGQLLSTLNQQQIINQDLVFNNLTQGFYLLTIKVEGQIITKKVVIN
jgi:endonuclease I